MLIPLLFTLLLSGQAHALSWKESMDNWVDIWSKASSANKRVRHRGGMQRYHLLGDKTAHDPNFNYEQRKVRFLNYAKDDIEYSFPDIEKNVYDKVIKWMNTVYKLRIEPKMVSKSTPESTLVGKESYIIYKYPKVIDYAKAEVIAEAKEEAERPQREKEAAEKEKERKRLAAILEKLKAELVEIKDRKLTARAKDGLFTQRFVNADEYTALSTNTVDCGDKLTLTTNADNSITASFHGIKNILFLYTNKDDTSASPDYEGARLFTGIPAYKDISRDAFLIDTSDDTTPYKVSGLCFNIEEDEIIKRLDMQVNSYYEFANGFIDLPVIQDSAVNKRYSGQFLYRDGKVEVFSYSEIPYEDISILKTATVTVSKDTQTITMPNLYKDGEAYTFEMHLLADGTYEVDKFVIKTQ